MASRGRDRTTDHGQSQHFRSQSQLVRVMLAVRSAVAAAPPLRRRMFGAAELHAFEETGYCIFRGVLPQHELAALRGLVEYAISRDHLSGEICGNGHISFNGQ